MGDWDRVLISLTQYPDDTTLDIAATANPDVVELTTRPTGAKGAAVRIPVESLIGLVNAVVTSAHSIED